ncbi:hypothetical protein ACHWQZ_G012558 [Mnemiopsis leidyi]
MYCGCFVGDWPVFEREFCGLKRPSPPRMAALSLEAPDTKEGARISVFSKGTLYGVKNPDRTLPDLFEEGRTITGDGNFLGTTSGNGYNFLSYNDADKIRKQIGSALAFRGLKKGDMVGISSQNTAEWTLVGLGCDVQSFTMVPLYDTLGEEGVKYILNQTELTVLFAHPKTLKSYLAYLPETKAVKLLVKLPSPDVKDCTPEELKAAEEHNVDLVTWEQFIQTGIDNPVEPNFPTPDDVVTLCYTSGTTGFPKGAMLTHRNLVSATVAVMTQLEGAVMTKEDVHMSYLPASHIFERLVQTAIIMVGASMGFWQGDVKKLAIDMQALKPSIFPAVPRILNRLYDKVQTEVSASKLKSALFNFALNSKLKGVEAGYVTKSSMWDYIVFKKVQNMLGGNIRLMAVGAAPIKPAILQFFRAALGALVFEGYGQTECCGACSVTLYSDHSLGHVGGILNSTQVKLESVEEMGYLASENKGEICIKGINVFKGYYKNEEKTKETVDEDGWLHTGDIGEWTKDWALKIIDRKKNIFKLSQGEYIAPEKIELLYDRAALVGQCLIYGHSLKSNLVAIVVPDELAAASWAESKNISGTFEELCQRDDLKEEIMKQVNEKGRAGGLKSFEFAKKIHLSPIQFSVENDLTTPTFKLKRHNIAKFYKDEIDTMYKDLD